MKKYGFTLAEVLITIVIIGIIAAITVSSIIQSTQKQEYVSKLRKAHSVLSQAMTRIAITEGYQVGDISDMSNVEFFNSFSNTVNTVKICTANGEGCFGDSYLSLNGSKNYSSYNNRNSLITSDGIAYHWDGGTTDLCSNKGLTSEDNNNCNGRFLVDINADRSPNKFGYDIFFFVVVKNKGIVPAGSGNNSADCKRSSSGITCAAKVLKEGKIDY